MNSKDVLTTKEQWDILWSNRDARENVDLDINKLFPTKFLNAIKDATPIGNKARVVELGGGNGQFLLKFAADGYSTTAMDVSEIGLSKTKDLFSKFGYDVECVQMDMFDISPDYEAQFDLVFSNGLCEHFTGAKRRQQFIQHRLLVREGGGVCILVPNRISPFRMFWRAGRFLISHLPYFRSRYDVKWVDENQFTKWELKRLCHEAGLDIVAEMGTSLLEDAYFFFWGGFKKFICRSIGKSTKLKRGKYLNKLSPIDNYLGSDLFLLGLKK